MAEPTWEVEVRVRPGQTVSLGTNIDQVVQHQVEHYLQWNIDIFAWNPQDLPGLDPRVFFHNLNVSLYFLLIQQKQQCFAPLKNIK